MLDKHVKKGVLERFFQHMTVGGTLTEIMWKGGSKS